MQAACQLIGVGPVQLRAEILVVLGIELALVRCHVPQPVQDDVRQLEHGLVGHDVSTHDGDRGSVDADGIPAGVVLYYPVSRQVQIPQDEGFGRAEDRAVHMGVSHKL